MKKQPFAAFDIDGTIFRWQLFHELIFELVKVGQLPFAIEEKVAQPRKQWLDRAAPDAFKEYEQALLQTLKDSLKGVSVEITKKLAQEIVEKSGNKVYCYTRDLAHSLRKEGYFLIAISGSFQEIVDTFSKKFGFDAAIGVKSEHKDGIFTGQIMPTHDRKGKILQDLVQRHNLTWKNSIAVGDSRTDISMLKLVEKPLAFNPDKELLACAKENGWDIVVERKSIAFKLTAKNGVYYWT